MSRYNHKAGIYAIEMVGTGRLYIGSSMDIPRRWFAHKSYLARGLHHSSKLQNAWNKYGAAAFQWVVLEVCPKDVTKEELLAREQNHIDNRRPWFNILPTAGSRYGSVDEQITRQRKSAARRRMTDLVTHCPKGHEYAPENTHLTKRNQRICLECARLRMAAKLSAETPEQTAARLARLRDYHERNLERHREKMAAYTASHKAEKRAYDQAHSQLKREQDKARRSTPEARLAATEAQRRRRARLKDSRLNVASEVSA